MPAINTATILQGPCKVVYGGATFYSEGAVTVKLVEDRWMVKVQGFRTMQERARNRRYEISFKPAGEWRNLAVLFPYGATPIGTQIFNNTPLTIWTREATANKRVYSNAAITKLPGILAHVKDTILGDVTFTCLLKNNTLPGASDAYVVRSNDTYPVEALDISTIVSPIYSHVWGGDAPWSSFNVGDGGVVYDFPLELRDQNVDGLGTVNMVLKDHRATAKFTPVGITEAQLLAAVGANTVFGSAPTTNNLVVAGAGVDITLYAAQLRDENLNYSTEADRIGEVMAMATQGFEDGAELPLYRIDTEAEA